jgi:hypothetical protein
MGGSEDRWLLADTLVHPGIGRFHRRRQGRLLRARDAPRGVDDAEPHEGELFPGRSGCGRRAAVRQMDGPELLRSAPPGNEISTSTSSTRIES